MTVAAASAVGAILDHYADVIEGGNAYNSGTVYRGIPGTDSVSEHAGDTITASATAASTALVASGVAQSTGHILARATGPAFYVRCLTATQAANVGAARRITAYTPNTLTVQAFPAAITASDTFTVQEGFFRAPDTIALEDEDGGIGEGHDRSFALSLTVGERMDMAGANLVTYRGTMNVRLRLLRHYRDQKIEESAASNIAIMRAVITRGSSPDHRDGTYVRALLYPEGPPEILVSDNQKLVIEDRYLIVYRVQRSFV